MPKVPLTPMKPTPSGHWTIIMRRWSTGYEGYVVGGFFLRPDRRHAVGVNAPQTIGEAMRLWLTHGYETEILGVSHHYTHMSHEDWQDGDMEMFHEWRKTLIAQGLVKAEPHDD